jgi:hypothetical protein
MKRVFIKANRSASRVSNSLPYGSATPGRTDLLKGKQVIFPFTEDEGSIFTSSDILNVEKLKFIGNEAFITMPEFILGLARKNAACGIAIAVFLDVGVDQIAPVIADTQLTQGAGGNAGPGEMGAYLFGEIVLVLANLSVDSLAGIVGLGQKSILDPDRNQALRPVQSAPAPQTRGEKPPGTQRFKQRK